MPAILHDDALGNGIGFMLHFDRNYATGFLSTVEALETLAATTNPHVTVVQQPLQPLSQLIRSVSPEVSSPPVRPIDPLPPVDRALIDAELRNLLLNIVAEPKKAALLRQYQFEADQLDKVAESLSPEDQQILEKAEAGRMHVETFALQPAIQGGHVFVTERFIEELNYAANRFARVQEKWLDFVDLLPTELKAGTAGAEVPRLGLCFSGGGYRAMLGTSVFLSWLQKENILDLATYAAGLSGTYPPAPGDRNSLVEPANWDRAKAVMADNPMWQFFPQKFSDLLHRPPNYQYIAAAKARRVATGRPFSVSEIFGIALALKLISPPSDPEARFMDWGLSDIGEKLVQEGEALWPMPIFTAISATEERPWWFEFTPWSIGNKEHGYVPVRSLARPFAGGEVTGGNGEDWLSLEMAVFGSAYAFSVKDLPGYFPERTPERLKNVILHALGKEHEAVIDHGTLTVPNFFWQLDEPLAGKGGLEKDSHLKLRDAGLSGLNLPFEPLLARQCDVVLVGDFSAGGGGSTLCGSEEIRNFFTANPDWRGFVARLPKGVQTPAAEVVWERVQFPDRASLFLEETVRLYAFAEGAGKLARATLVLHVPHCDRQANPLPPSQVPSTMSFAYKPEEVDAYVKVNLGNLDAAHSVIVYTLLNWQQLSTEFLKKVGEMA